MISLTSRIFDFAGRRFIGSPASLGFPEALKHLYWTRADRTTAQPISAQSIAWQRQAIALNHLTRAMTLAVARRSAVLVIGGVFAGMLLLAIFGGSHV